MLASARSSWDFLGVIKTRTATMAHDPSLGFADYFSAADAASATLMPAMDHEGPPELYGLQNGMDMLGMHRLHAASAMPEQQHGHGDGAGTTMRFFLEQQQQQQHQHHHHLGLDVEAAAVPETSRAPSGGAAPPGVPPFLAAAMNFKLAVDTGGGSGATGGTDDAMNEGAGGASSGMMLHGGGDDDGA
jgi:hypothetical protein